MIVIFFLFSFSRYDLLRANTSLHFSLDKYFSVVDMCRASHVLPVQVILYIFTLTFYHFFLNHLLGNLNSSNTARTYACSDPELPPSKGLSYTADLSLRLSGNSAFVTLCCFMLKP